MKKKLIGLVIMGLVGSFVLTGCDQIKTNDQKQATVTEQLQEQASAKLGMPNIKNFYEKKIMKDVMEACDNSNLITYAYLQSAMTGKFVYLGQAIGFPVPYSTEYTNPERPLKNSETQMQGNATISQADPNGLYKPQGVAATWLMLVNSETKKAEPMYCEPNLVVYTHKLPRLVCDTSTLPSDY